MLLRRMALIVGAAFVFTLVLSSSSPPAAAQGAGSAAAALAGQVASTEEGPMEGVIGQRPKKEWFAHHHQCHHQRAGPLQLPGGATSSPGGTACKFARSDTTSKAPRMPMSRQEQPASADLKLRKTRNLQQAAHQCRVDDERPRHR